MGSRRNRPGRVTEASWYPTGERKAPLSHGRAHNTHSPRSNPLRIPPSTDASLQGPGLSGTPSSRDMSLVSAGLTRAVHERRRCRAPRFPARPRRAPKSQGKGVLLFSAGRVRGWRSFCPCRSPDHHRVQCRRYGHGLSVTWWLTTNAGGASCSSRSPGMGAEPDDHQTSQPMLVGGRSRKFFTALNRMAESRRLVMPCNRQPPIRMAQARRRLGSRCSGPRPGFLSGDRTGL